MAEEMKVYVRDSFLKEYKEDAANAMIKMISFVDDIISENRELISENKKLKRQPSQIHFRFAYVACQQLVEHIAKTIKSAHKGKRPVNCKGVSLGSTADILSHLASCTMFDEKLQVLFDMGDGASLHTSNLLHTAMFTDEQVLTLPSIFSPVEISLLVRLAAHHRLRVKIVDFNGMDVTKRCLSDEQLKLLNI